LDHVSFNLSKALESSQNLSFPLESARIPIRFWFLVSGFLFLVPLFCTLGFGLILPDSPAFARKLLRGTEGLARNGSEFGGKFQNFFPALFRPFPSQVGWMGDGSKSRLVSGWKNGRRRVGAHGLQWAKPAARNHALR
jgi:hypothetical protein